MRCSLPRRTRPITVHGFYLGTNDWKVRFAPWEIGGYSYHVTVAGGASPKTIDRSFNSVASAEKGFVRSSTQNPLRLVYETDGSLYNALGMGNCIGAASADWGLDGGDTSKGEPAGHANRDTYLTAMGVEGKLNIFRWSVNNCAPDLWQTIAPSGNTYLAQQGVWGDQLVQILRKHGFRVYLDMFGWKQPYSAQWQDTPSMDAVKRYVDYIVARYGAYVDFWEVCNQSSPPTGWISLVASYVESIDPYHHLVSSSREHPELPAIGIASPHWYEKEAELSSDTSTVQKSRLSATPTSPSSSASKATRFKTGTRSRRSEDGFARGQRSSTRGTSFSRISRAPRTTCPAPRISTLVGSSAEIFSVL